MALGLVSPAAGSAYVELGGTKVVAAVYGPKPSFDAQFTASANVETHVSSAPFAAAGERTSYVPSDSDAEASLLVQAALAAAVRRDAYPKSTIEGRLLVLEDDGATTGACVSAASLALAHAGIEMYDLAVGATVVQLGDALLVDPSRPEEDAAQGAVALAYMPAVDELSQYALTGQFDPATLATATELALDAARKWAELMRTVLRDSVTAQSS